jgi:hypothetical protein
MGLDWGLGHMYDVHFWIKKPSLLPDKLIWYHTKLFFPKPYQPLYKSKQQPFEGCLGSWLIFTLCILAVGATW